MFLIYSQGPLPFEHGKNHNAGGLRTIQFLEAVIKKNKEFILVSIHDELENMVIVPYPNSKGYMVKISKDEALKVKNYVPMIAKYLKLEDIEPTSLVGINNFPAYIASLAKDKFFPKLSFWADLNGWLMAESVSQAINIQDDSSIPYFWKIEKQILKNADHISTVSDRQKWAIYGELMSLGYMNSTSTEDFIFVVPNAQNIDSFNLNNEQNPDYLYKKYKIPKDKFLVLSNGGYNTWMDTSTMFRGLEMAMKENPDIYFVSTGGAIKGLSDVPYNNFLEKIKRSKYKNRFLMLGWIDRTDVEALYRICDLGISIDTWNIETATGARNRITEMMLRKVPVLTTSGTEIAWIIKEKSLGFVVDRENPKELAQEILKVYDFESPVLERYRKESFAFAMQYFSPDFVLFYFKIWLDMPVRRDIRHISINKFGIPQLISKFFKTLKTRGFKQTIYYTTRHWKRLFRIFS